MSRSRDWCFTDFDVASIAPWFKNITCVYVIVGQEIAPTTGAPHFQGYVVWPNPITLKGCKKRSREDVHWEICHGSIDQNVSYCSKEHVFYEHGIKPEPGHRSDLAAIRDLVMSGNAGPSDVIALAPNYQSLKYGLTLLMYAPPPVRDPPVVHWFYGPAGTGKTRTAVEQCLPNRFWMSSGKLDYANGYCGEAYIILDDLRIPDDITLPHLFRFIDRYSYSINMKNTHLWSRAKQIYITSPLSPSHIPGSVELISQLTRRLDEIRYFSGE